MRSAPSSSLKLKLKLKLNSPPFFNFPTPFSYIYIYIYISNTTIYRTHTHIYIYIYIYRYIPFIFRVVLEYCGCFFGKNMSEGTSLAMESSENGTDLSQDDAGAAAAEDTILSRASLVPFVGQRFVSQEAAYEFYCGFAKQCGFSIRRHRTRGKDGVGRGVTRRDFTCHRAGYPQAKPPASASASASASDDAKLQRNRKSSRCGCQAYVRIVKRAGFDHVPEWRVTGFSNAHNHELMRPNEACLLIPPHCAMSPDDKSRICMFAKAGMSVRQMLRLMELEKGVKLGCLPFTEFDVRNLLQSFRSVGRDHDAIDLVSMCKVMKDEDPNFKYGFEIDGNNRLEHIAWSYTLSVQMYESFGDAVVFDTTHRLEGYDMLLGIWLGVDNHGMTCFFGCVLLRDENVRAFSWALKAFLEFMKGKAPQTILTDHNTWLKEAIANEMPQTKHAFCMWHIVAKFSNWFSALLGSHYDEWKAEFHRLHSLELVEDFEEGWRDMINKYGLHTNRHIISLYALRAFWAFAFLRQYFFTGMTSTFQAESINSFIQRILSAQSQLDRFVPYLADVIYFKDQGGSKHKMQQKLPKVCLKAGSPIESHAASILTPYAFGKLQEELVLAPQYASVMVDDGVFQVRHHAQMDGGCKVIWLPCQEHIRCSCHKFEFSGILCRHVLRVLSTNNCFHIPDQYLPTRWREASSSSTSEKVQLLESMTSILMAESVETEERLDAACEQITMVLSRIKGLPQEMHSTNDAYNCQSDSLMLQEVEDADGIVRFTVGNPHESISSGKLKERRGRDGVDIARKRRHCAGPCCGQFGHDASECQLIGDDHLNGDALGYL